MRNKSVEPFIEGYASTGPGKPTAHLGVRKGIGERLVRAGDPMNRLLVKRPVPDRYIVDIASKRIAYAHPRRGTECEIYGDVSMESQWGFSDGGSIDVQPNRAAFLLRIGDNGNMRPLLPMREGRGEPDEAVLLKVVEDNIWAINMKSPDTLIAGA